MIDPSRTPSTSPVTPALRTVTYERDRHRCVTCGAQRNLSYQHRQAVGMGGSKRRLQLYEGVTACLFHNMRFESDMQAEAIRYGWKVPRWVKDCSAVPVYYVWARQWFALDRYGEKHRISRDRAVSMMREIYGDYDLQEGEG